MLVFLKLYKLHNVLRRKRVLSEFQYPTYLLVLKGGISGISDCERLSLVFFSMSILSITHFNLQDELS